MNNKCNCGCNNQHDYNSYKDYDCTPHKQHDCDYNCDCDCNCNCNCDCDCDDDYEYNCNCNEDYEYDCGCNQQTSSSCHQECSLEQCEKYREKVEQLFAKARLIKKEEDRLICEAKKLDDEAIELERRAQKLCKNAQIALDESYRYHAEYCHTLELADFYLQKMKECYKHANPHKHVELGCKKGCCQNNNNECCECNHECPKRCY